MKKITIAMLLTTTYIYIYVLYIYINTDPPQVVPTSWGHHAGYAAFCQIEIHQSN